MRVCGVLQSDEGIRYEIRAGAGRVEIDIPSGEVDVLSFDSETARQIGQTLIKAAEAAGMAVSPIAYSAEISRDGMVGQADPQ